MTNTTDEVQEALQLLAQKHGMSVEDVQSLLSANDSPLVKDHISDYLAHCTSGTRRTYGTPLRRFRDGIGPVCDEMCDPCVNRTTGYLCNCECRKCRESRLTLPALGDLPVGADVYSKRNVATLSAIAQRLAVKSGVDANRRRADRGQKPRRAEGRGAAETTVAALRSLFKFGIELCGGVNAGAEVPKPRRNPRGKRPIQPFELMDLHYLTATGGDDPDLDTLILDFGIATGARREGVVELTVGQLSLEGQIIEVKDKFDRAQPTPVSFELIERLFAHAIERGGEACDPNSPAYSPDSIVFRYKNDGRPLTGRRFDTLASRWQRGLDWANTEQFAFHHVRHSMGAFLESQYGRAYKKRYLRHADGDVTDGYGVCQLDQLASAMSELLRFTHPLVDGFSERRSETLTRFGMTGATPGPDPR